MYKRNRASGNSGEKIACGKIMRVIKRSRFKICSFFSKCIIR